MKNAGELLEKTLIPIKTLIDCVQWHIYEGERGFPRQTRNS